MLPSQEGLIRELLRSHSHLPAGQASSLISSLSDELSKCDTEIARLEDRRAKLRDLYRDSQGLLAPARRLPPEILTAIFALSSAASTCESDAPSAPSAMACLANSSILAVSQVCSRWHGIAMNTPSLWSEIQLDAVLWQSPDTTPTAMALLQAFLTRGVNFPLTIRVRNTTTSPFYGPPLQLLAQHSLRWRAATFECPVTDFHHLTGVKGRLPMLEALDIRPEGETVVVDTWSLFAVAPRLTQFTGGVTSIGRISTPPTQQITRLGLCDLVAGDLPVAVSTMASLSQMNEFRVRFYFDNWATRNLSLRLNIPPTSSDINRLSIGVEGDFYRNHCQQALGGIFAALTLPHLQFLTFDSDEYPRFPLTWPNAQFLTLSQRSGFHDHLRSLSLFHVQITEAELLRCLSVLPALTHLAIADHERIGLRGANLQLITNSFLRALTRLPAVAPCLVPHLESLHMRSKLVFTDSAYLDMLLSRVEPGGRGFTSLVEMLPQWKTCREFHRTVVSRLYELVARGELTMSLPS
ncbi:hypothetical protein C8R46DRAFT_963296 [Mycena filopes]|nr:hypothetical protein C8R46DRAFT_963296 [Mycena filopes]